MNTKGFTLVELLVTLSLFAIFAAIAVPAFNETIATQQVRSIASDMHSALFQARSEAIKRNAIVSLNSLADGWGSGWTVIDIEAPGGPETIAVRQDLPSSVSISGPADGVEFRSSGRTNLNVSFEIGNTSVSTIKRCIRIDLSGRPSVHPGACS